MEDKASHKSKIVLVITYLLTLFKDIGIPGISIFLGQHLGHTKKSSPFSDMTILIPLDPACRPIIFKFSSDEDPDQ